MTYIDRIKSGNKTFYYLGKTIRIGPNKWKKIRIKLGTEKPPKELISEKLKELKLEELDIYNSDYIDANKLEVIDDFKEVYQNHIKKMVNVLKKRRDYAYKSINEIDGLSTAKPQGAFYIFPKIEEKIWKNDREFVLEVLNSAHVLFVHGSGFCPVYGKNHFRAVFLPPIETMEKAFNKLNVFMKKRLES